MHVRPQICCSLGVSQDWVKKYLLSTSVPYIMLGIVDAHMTSVLLHDP